MSLKSILRGVAPLAALAFAAAASGGCDKMHVSINGEEGQRLSELDLGGEAPTEVALMCASPKGPSWRSRSMATPPPPTRCASR